MDCRDPQGRSALVQLANNYKAVTDEAAVLSLAARIHQEHGGVRLLVNNAGIMNFGPSWEMSMAQWHRVLDVNLIGVLHGVTAFMPHMVDAARSGRRAAVVNIGGLTAHTGAANRVHVVTAKAGLVGMTRALAHDFADSGITVNCVAPGMLDTQRDSASASAQPAHHAKHRPLLGRRGSAQEVADSVRFLASDGARFITGQVLHVNGGTYLGG